MLYRDFFRFFEAKDHLINRLNLTDEQKEELIQFFKKHPNYEGKIDWNKKDLQWSDFQELLSLEGTSRNSIKKYGKSGKAQIEDLVEGQDYNILYSDDGIICYEVLTFKGSEVLAKPSTPPEGVTGAWCIAGRNYSPGTGDQHWRQYTSDGKRFIFLFTESEKWALCISPNKSTGIGESRIQNYKRIAQALGQGRFSEPGIYMANGLEAELLTPDQYKVGWVEPKIQVFNEYDRESYWNDMVDSIDGNTGAKITALADIRALIAKRFGTPGDVSSNPDNARVQVDDTLAIYYRRPDGKNILIGPPRKAVDTWVIPEGITSSNMVLTENETLRNNPELYKIYSKSHIPAILNIVMPSTMQKCEWAEFLYIFDQLKSLKLMTLKSTKDPDFKGPEIPYDGDDLWLYLKNASQRYLFGDWELLNRDGKPCDIGARDSKKQIITTKDKEVFELIEHQEVNDPKTIPVGMAADTLARDKYGCVYWIKKFKVRPGNSRSGYLEERTTWYYDQEPVPIDACIKSLKNGANDITFVLTDIPKTITEFVAPKYLTRIMGSFNNLPNLKSIVFPDYSKEFPELYISGTENIRILNCPQLEYVDFANRSFGIMENRQIVECPKLKTVKFGPCFYASPSSPILFDCLNVETLDFSHYSFEKSTGPQPWIGGKALILDFMYLRSDKELKVILPKIPDGCRIDLYNSSRQIALEKYKNIFPKATDRTDYYPANPAVEIIYPGTLAEFSAKVFASEGSSTSLQAMHHLGNLLTHGLRDGGIGVKRLVCKDKTLKLPISTADYYDYQIIGQQYKAEHGLSQWRPT